MDLNSTFAAGDTCQNRGRILMDSTRRWRVEVRFRNNQKSLAFPRDP